MATGALQAGMVVTVDPARGTLTVVPAAALLAHHLERLLRAGDEPQGGHLDHAARALDLVEVIMAMEQEFDVEISDEDAEKIRTVGDAVSYINEHQSA